jgi:SAM-dependent methyltransferase
MLKRLFCSKSREPEKTDGSSKLLNLGCGGNLHPAWDNYDFTPVDSGVRPIDLSQPLPFNAAAYRACYMSHVLEHLPRERVPRLLSELFNALKPGGLLRVVVPDLETIARLYLAELEAAAAGDPVAADRHEWMTLEMLDQMTRSFPGGFMGRSLRVRPLPISNFIVQRFGSEAKKWLDASDASVAQLKREEVYQVGAVAAAAECSFRQSGEVHRWMYDRVSLGALLKQSGFEGIRVCRADESSIKEFGHYRLDTDDDGSVRKPDSLFMEAIKPGTPN